MAKHKIGKQVSKGQRRSSIKAGAPKKPAIIVQPERVTTNMREAFLNITVANYNAQARDVVDTILTCAKQNAGNNKPGRGWTANLTPQTVRRLSNEGVFA